MPPAPATTARHIKQRDVVTPEPNTIEPADLCEDPSAFYVNYHTQTPPSPAFPMGAIRGQLR